MAKYTIELRDVVKNHDIFRFNYDFYDEKQRQKFERDFIRHFYFHEIGSVTIDRFILQLEDKMNTVFPYYNEMFKATQIEYDILDNYKLTETITTKRENQGRTSGIASTVGQTFDKQSSENEEERTIDTLNIGKTTSENAILESSTSESISNGSSDTDSNGSSETDSNGSRESEKTIANDTTSESDKTTTSETTNTDHTVKKFLDTPQGLTDLTDSRYLTTLGDDTTTGTGTTEASETLGGSTTSDTTESETGTNTDHSKTTTTDHSKTTTTDGTSSEGSREVGENGTIDETSTGEENLHVKGSNSFEGEQKTTADNNTRTETEGSLSEVMETVRRGNIGIDTDSDAIHKHLKLQQLLRKIELMFFEECEDLFMLVY